MASIDTVSNSFAMLLDLIFLYFAKQKAWKSMALAVIPTLIFLISGITLRHIPLVICAIVFGVGHIYVTTSSLS